MEGEDTEKLPESFDSFKDNTVYRAEITLMVNNDYLFDKDMHFYYPQGSIKTQEIIPSDEPSELVRKVSVTYKPTEKATILGGTIDDAIALDMMIPEPVTGGIPQSIVTDPNTIESKYTGVIIWSPSHDTFQTGTAYTATVMLYTTPGYEFAGTCNFTHTASGAEVLASHSDGTIILVAIEFAATTAN
jgi:hypothetical protein